MSNMDLDTAYEIAGGYIEADEKTFAQALEIVRKNDEEFAKSLEEAHKYELAFKKKQEEAEVITASPKELADNTEFLYNELDNDDIKNSLLSDGDVKTAINNTPIVDGKDGAGVSLEERNKHIDMLIEKAKLDVMLEQSRSHDFASQSIEEKRETLFDEVKDSFLGTLVQLRTAAQIQNNIPNAADAVVNDDKEFFVKQQEALGNMALQDKAIDMEEKIEVSSDLVITACAESEVKAESYRKKLADKALSAKGKAQECFSKASIFVNKAKTSFSEKAKQVWGQRYEFAKNLKDRSPKVITDVAATAGLIVGTATSAPWLGTAVVAYGAYKAASSWVWPIITEARRTKRLEKEVAKKEGNTAPKVRFLDRLKNASNNIFSNKEKRKAYYKEAGWGSAAGLVGLGAAGAVASGALGSLGSGVGAIAARSAQRLSSLAVSSVNNTINTVHTLKNKKKDFWDKAFTVAGFIGVSAIMVNCCDGENPDIRSTADLGDAAANKAANSLLNNVNEQTGLAADTASVEVDTAKVDTLFAKSFEANDSLTNQADSVSLQSAVVEQEVEANNLSNDMEVSNVEITPPTEWSEETGITKAQWKRLQSFWGNSDKYQEFYCKIDDSMLQAGGQFEGMTRDEVLFKYERMSSWNLPQHRETIAKLDAFFGCDEQITNDDVTKLSDVLDNGAIKDVEGKDCVVVTGRDVNCGEKAVLHSQTYDCGCDEEIVEVIEETPTIETEEIIFEEREGSSTTVYTNDNSFDLYKADNIGNEELIGSEIPTDKLEENLNVTDQEMVVRKNISTEVVEGAAVEEVVATGGINTGVEAEIVADEAAIEVTNTEVIATGGVNTGVEAEIVTDEAAIEVTNTEVIATGGIYTGVEAEIIFDETATEVIADSDEVEVGTPAAGNVPERGGFENTGITEKQYNLMQTFFKDNFGEDAYDDYAARITDEMRAKGGIFEGLSVEQSMFSIKQMIAWSNDEHGKFAKEITNVVDYLKECDDSISVENATKIKEVIDSVNENGTIDGVTGTSPVMVRYFTAGACEEAGSYTTEQASSGVTNPGSDGFDRYYMRPTQNVSPEPIFEEREGTITYAEEKTDDTFSLHKGYEYDGKEIVSTEKVADNIPTRELEKNLNVKDVDMVVRRKVEGR
ncbi:MAG: hypothetical protein IJZ30_01980 [Alphaproteobacteria bacterium]|nr:hypothetical protein [Alphaproteobacteria bacterium]